MKKHLCKSAVTAFLAIIILLAISLALPRLPAHAAETDPECWGLFIGVATYASNPPLIYADDDARALYEVFSPVWGASHTKLLIDSGSTEYDILNGIAWLADNARANDTVVFTFSGLGVAPGAICPADFEAVKGGLTIAELSAAFAPVQAKNIVFILDCNYAGKFRVGLSKEGRILMFSSTEQETSQESPEYQHGIFTYFLLQALHNFDTFDVNQNYELSAEEIALYAGAMTPNAFQYQHPIIEDRVAGELPLIAKFDFSLSMNLPAGTIVLTLDDVPYASPPDTQYWVPGSTHVMTVPNVVYIGNGTRYIFTGWRDGDSSVERAVSKGSYTANYVLLRLLTVTSPYGETIGSGWYNDGSNANFSVTPSIVTPDTKRYFTVWSGDFTGISPAGTLTMNGPKIVNANWRTEYLLTLNSESGSVAGSGWYDAWEKVDISVEPEQGFLVRQIFDGWSGDFIGTTASAEITMDSPKVITAVWHTDYLRLYILIAVVIVIIGGTPAAIYFIYRKRRSN